ncbi:DJ-1/PfpI family protein [Sarocladium implicatum]|nr:DJ-1/PfpI family protein [Sarocladium implicatum]
MAPRILVILTSHGPQDAPADFPYGWWLPELAHPYTVFSNAGATVKIVSPKGGETYVSPLSVQDYTDETCTNFVETQQDVWKKTELVESYLGRSEEFDAVFVPGGAGPMIDLTDHAHTQKLIAEFWEAGKVVSAICHGQAALLNARLSTGSPLLEGKNVTAFPTAVEDSAGTAHVFPYRLETRMREIIKDGRFEVADEPLGGKVVVDGKLVTGQNPNSAVELSESVLGLIN